jgi:antitoxin YefM
VRIALPEEIIESAKKPVSDGDVERDLCRRKRACPSAGSEINRTRPTVDICRVKNTYTIKTLQRDKATVNCAESGDVVTITRHDEPVAVMLSHQRLTGMLETMELLANLAFGQAVRKERAGKGRYHPIDVIPDKGSD